MTDRQTDRQTNRQTDAQGKTICHQTLKGGDIIITNLDIDETKKYEKIWKLIVNRLLKLAIFNIKTVPGFM